ncbi:MAG: class I SAM-dependent methyltransferase [Desulfovibrio sp.]
MSSSIDAEIPVVDSVIPYDFDVVREAFGENGLPVVPYNIDVPHFEEYMSSFDDIYSKTNYAASGEAVLYEKCLEHYLSLQFCEKLDENAVLLDVANAGSCFPTVIQRMSPCNIIANDLVFRKGVFFHAGKVWRFGGSAGDLPFAEKSVDLITVHCALEMFQGNHDMEFFSEAQRVLKPGGVLVIIPLYMHEHHIVYRDSNCTGDDLPEVPANATLVHRKNFYNVSFARVYNVRQFVDRLVSPFNNLDTTIYEIANGSAVHPSIYARWIGVFKKK